ncbi:mechanosensitive ion channel family protein [Luteibacter aegosomaticola]|uniref:mechanosensitive ion channel family protein n=1 Tax=Luteibacter aegosomaticola TaxID=2911538 RepID=UPI001FFBAA0E|nr:mechanosensitive ion channel domain-containing protein [Luteibacter aegosomaticola]UPG91870.1 mechanosensitive ion channel family protein [Luteibacter aegosomaticola]
MNSSDWMPDITHPWTRFALVIIIALAVAGIVHRAADVFLRRFAIRHPMGASIVARANTPLEAIVPLAMVLLAFRVAPDEPARLIDGLEHLLGVCLIGACTWFLVRCIGAVEATVSRFNPIDLEDNLRARRLQTQSRVLARTGMVVTVVLGIGVALMTFPAVRQFGASLLASAGIAGIAVGLAAKPVLGNLIAGIQIALTQPIRIDDVVIIEGEWGRVEEITSTYVVVKIWDERRMIVPLQYFIETPFQNWTRTSSQILGSVLLWFDYGLPLEPLRAEMERICKAAPEWDSRVMVMQVVDSNDKAMQVRALMSSSNSGKSFDLRCKVREGLIAFVKREYPAYLPRLRGDLENQLRGVEDAPVPFTARRAAR